jgi:L-ascorbate metabolism protein UlaG (beta-lactamase superfamily)
MELHMSDDLCLRRNIQLEPLVDLWYAWSHLISPATAARNVSERHIKIMKSYISAPTVHANAVANEQMRGGPFIDYAGKRVDEIHELLDRTVEKRRSLLELSKALADLNSTLQDKCQGYALADCYNLVPPALKGYVELVYDLNNAPSYRLIESLLYRSQYHSTETQTMMLSQISKDERPFILSTPRLPGQGMVHLNMPFHDDAIDYLFSAKTNPRSFTSMIDNCDVSERDCDTFRSFFTTETGGTCSSYDGKGARWRYFGHACILLEYKGVSILFDPILSYTYEASPSRYTYDDLPGRLDYVIITHNHQDHLLLETLLQLRHKTETVVVPRSNGSLQDPSLRLALQSMGFRSVIELDELQELEITGGAIVGIPFFGEHADLDVRSKLAYLVRIDGKQLMFAADSCNLETQMYRHVQRCFGDIDVLFVGMECDGAPLSWLYGPLLSRPLERQFDQARRLNGSNCDQAVEIIEALKCKEVYVYAMGQEPWLGYITSLKYTGESHPIVQSNRLLDYCREHGIAAERLYGEREVLVC